MRKVISVCMMICFILTISACGTKETPKPTEQVSENLLKGKHHAVIDVKDYGTIELELDADTAPITVTNFVELAKDGFYDGLTFHRNIEDFMIQGGDPNGNGTGGSKHTIKGEFSANGVENNIKHERGVISMARSQDYNSASSQFFIMYEKGFSFGWAICCIWKSHKRAGCIEISLRK